MPFSRALYNSDPEKATKLADPSQPSFRFADYNYGKQGVRVFEANRNDPVHIVKEYEVSALLRLNKHDEYYKGVNSNLLGSDVAEVVIYMHAQKYGLKTPEEFALSLSQYFLDTYDIVEMSNIKVKALQWQRLGEHDSSANGGYYKDKPHNHAFILNENGMRTCEVIRKRNSTEVLMLGGIQNLRVVKSGCAPFVGYMKQALATDGDNPGRILRVALDGQWQYKTIDGIDFSSSWYRVQDVIFKTFAGDQVEGTQTYSTQYLLYQLEQAIMKEIPEINSVLMTSKNLTLAPYDFSRFPPFEPKAKVEICLPADLPYSEVLARTDRLAEAEKFV